MIVRDEIRKCVVFLGMKKSDGEMVLAGSGFFLGKRASEGRAVNTFLVTARHVIEGIRGTGVREIQVRANLKSGSTTLISSSIEDWVFHPTDGSVDVAVLKVRIAPELDHLVIPDDLCATDAVMGSNEVGLGDEVFVVGLFRHHHGDQRNIPIVRVGNLAALGEERVQTERFGMMEALLVEARSIGGISGSPVFLNLGVVRHLGGKLQHAKAGAMFFLLGLVHGHFDEKNIDARLDDKHGLTRERVNTGIAIVVPISKILEVIGVASTD